VGWVCCWFSSLLRGFFYRFSSFPPSTKTNRFQFDQDRGPAWKPAKADVASSLNRVLNKFWSRRLKYKSRRREKRVPQAWASREVWGYAQGSRALALSNTGSSRFTDSPSNLANLIGWEYETNALRMLRKSGPARALHAWCTSVWSWALGTRMLKMHSKCNSVDSREFPHVDTT